ncbi:MAG: hypothetical protein AAF243_13795 [Cyanobacteria bacterium P01_A01_bin.137]
MALIQASFLIIIHHHHCYYSLIKIVGQLQGILCPVQTDECTGL